MASLEPGVGNAPTPVDLWSADGVFLARLDDDIVVLDVRSDEYACLIDAANWLELGQDGAITAPDPATAEDLIAAGIAITERSDFPRRRPFTPRRALRGEGEAAWPLTAGAGLTLLAATLAFQRKTLEQLLALPMPATGFRQPMDEDRLARSLAAARRALPWIPTEGECLQRAFELRWFLARQGVAVDWVFGVRTWPFAAHCWLQIGDLVVADSLDRVSRFTPIMTV